MEMKKKRLFTQALHNTAARKNQPRRTRVCTGPQNELLASPPSCIEAYLDIPTYLRQGVDIGSNKKMRV